MYRQRKAMDQHIMWHTGEQIWAESRQGFVKANEWLRTTYCSHVFHQIYLFIVWFPHLCLTTQSTCCLHWNLALVAWTLSLYCSCLIFVWCQLKSPDQAVTCIQCQWQYGILTYMWLKKICQKCHVWCSSMWSTIAWHGHGKLLRPQSLLSHSKGPLLPMHSPDCVPIYWIQSLCFLKAVSLLSSVLLPSFLIPQGLGINAS